MMHHESHPHCNIKTSTKRMALAATLHCLAGCMIGEMLGVTIGTHAGFTPHATVILASVLAFTSSYTVSTIPLVRAKLSFIKAFKLVFAADTLSILSMTIVDNVIMLVVPGAMNKDLTHPMYWTSRLLCMTAAFLVSYPVNLYLLRRGKGHALTHQYHHHNK